MVSAANRITFRPGTALAIVVVLGALCLSAAGAEEETITLSDLIRLCWDLDALPKPEEGASLKQFSSYDRSGWKANRDWGNYLRSSRQEGCVCGEMAGPGCVFRIWSANPSGELLFFLDDAEEPALTMNMNAYFTGRVFPFLNPLAYRISGSNSYFPIPYKKSCKIVLKGNSPLYYHFGYKTYPPGTEIETYSRKGAEGALKALETALSILEAPGPERLKDLYPGDLVEVPLDALVPPGEKAEILHRTGEAGRIALLQLKGTSIERHFLRKTLLRIYWDGESRPAVECPLGDFFGTSFGENLFRALPMGVTGEGGYCLFPMPFEEGVSIELSNQGTQPVAVKGRVMLGPLPGAGPFLRFHAGWRRENPCRTFDYPILEAVGKGKFVGCALYIHNPRARWWGEGDEKIWVDGEDFPSIFGTGSEDYFGDAWGHRLHVKPYEGCTLHQDPRHGNKTCVYRFHVTDSIPFKRSYKMTIENYADDVDYTSVAWWYQEKGGTDFFESVPVESRIPEKPKAIGALEAEDLALPAASGKTHPVRDEDLPRELSGGMGLLLSGEGPFSLNIPSPETGNFHLYLGFAHDLAHPGATISASAGVPFRPLSVPPGTPGFLECREAGVVHLEKGTNTFLLLFTDPAAGSDRAILDFIRLEPVKRREGAVEAEEMGVSSRQGGRIEFDHITEPWSAGTQLRFTAGQEIAVLDLELPIPMEGYYTLTCVCTSGEGYNPFNLYVDGKLMGELNPYTMEGDVIKEIAFEPMWLERGAHYITVGTQSMVGLDCFLLSWSLGDDVLEGEKLKVLDAAHGEHQLQGLDRRKFSQGLQLWFKGREEGAFLEVALPVEKTGDYELKIFYCKSADYGQVKLMVDGNPVGELFDGYNPYIDPSGAVDYGVIHLDEGERRLKFLITGKNEDSPGYFMGVDALILKPVE